MIKSLLQHITLTEIEDIILEDTLSKEGFEFHYFIDNYDIGKYSFPFGLLAEENYDRRSEKSIEIVTDEQIAYHYLFDIRTEKLLLADEHIAELNDFIGKIRRVEMFGLEVVDAFAKQADYFENIAGQKNISFDSWQQFHKISDLQVSLLLSIAIGSLLDGKKKINQLKNEDLILTQEAYQDNFENDNASIFDIKAGETTNLLYDKLISDFRSNISTQRAVSRYEKCKIFDRILNINRQTIAQKQIFLLLSSAKVTNTRLPEIARESGLLPEYEGIRINPVRSIQQIYLQLLLRDDENKLDELKKIKSIVALKENADYKGLHHIINDHILNEFDERLGTLREGFENTALLLKFNDYDNTLKQALDSQSIKRHQLIAESIKELIKIANETQALQQLKAESLEKLQYERDYDNTLKQAVNEINKGELLVEGYVGSDYITNRYHHTPIVFFQQTTDGYKRTLDEIINFIIGVNGGDGRNLIRSINKSFQLIFHNAVPTEEEKIIKILILLMLKNTKDIHPTQLAFDRAKQIYENELTTDEWKKEFLYILAWISRRLERYDESLQYAQAGIQLDDSDPRFYHALSLIQYCLYKKNNDTDALNEGIANAKKALDNYKKRPAKTLAVERSINALLNAGAYLKTLSYTHENDYNLLLEARKDIAQLKFNEAGQYYLTPEFLHTEAFLEYNEFKAFDSPSKLKFAKEAIQKAISLNPQPVYLQLKEQIEAEDKI